MRRPRCVPSGVAILSLLLVEISNASAQVPDFHTTRIRSGDSSINDLLVDGYRRSPTFARLVEEIQRSDGIVYVERGGCGSSVLHGCLMHQMVVAGGTRFLRIHVDVRNGRIEVIGRLGHELQHACEVLEALDVRSDKAMRALFQRIGMKLSGDNRSLETLAAVRAGEDVRGELQSMPRVPPTP